MHRTVTSAPLDLRPRAYPLTLAVGAVPFGKPMPIWAAMTINAFSSQRSSGSTEDTVTCIDDAIELVASQQRIEGQGHH